MCSSTSFASMGSSEWHCSGDCSDTPYISGIDWLFGNPQHDDEAAVAPQAKVCVVLPAVLGIRSASEEFSTLVPSISTQLSTVLLI